ncbi:MAG: hypothetical protein AB7L84_02725 [Acidimicrobiia bacterium]
MTVLVLVLAVAGWIVVPGCALAALAGTGDDDPWDRLARAMVLGLGTWILGSQLVMRTVGLSPVTCWVACAAVAAGSVAAWAVVSSRRDGSGSPGRPRHLAGGGRRRSTAPRSTTRRDLLAVAGLVALGLGAWAPVLAVNVASPHALLQPTPWYYWGLADETASAGDIPVEVREWGGTPVESLAAYPGFTSGTAALIAQSPGGGFEPARAVMVLTTVATLVGLAAVVAALGGTTVGVLVAVPGVLSLWIVAVKLASYRPEPTGYGLMLAAGALALRWMRSGDRSALVVGGVAFVALGQVHGIDHVLAAVMVAAAAACSLLVDRDGLRATAGRAAATLSWAAAWAGWTLLLTGSLSSAEAADGLPQRGGTSDPTWAFVRALSGGPVTEPPSALELARAALSEGIAGVSPVAFRGGVLVLVLALVGWAVLGRGEDRARAARVLVWVAAVAAGILAVCLWFALRWETYVPRRTGFSRMLQLVVLVIPVAAGLLASMRGRLGRVAAAVVLVAGAAATVRSWGPTTELFEYQRPTSEQIGLLASLDLSPGAVVLTNTYTEGIVADVLDASGLLEGRAPYTYPDLLDRAVHLLRESAAFFADPVAHQDLLEEEGVTHVLVATYGSYALGTPARFPWDPLTLAGIPGLREVARTTDLVLYEVDR